MLYWLLTEALARSKNAGRFDAVLAELGSVPQETICRSVEGFLSCSDLEPAIRCLRKVDRLDVS